MGLSARKWACSANNSMPSRVGMGMGVESPREMVDVQLYGEPVRSTFGFIPRT